VSCLLVAKAAVSDTDRRPEKKRFGSAGTAQEDIAMNTLFDHIAATLVTAAFAIACATGMVAMIATGLPTVA
jgi:hypothetical protein